MVGRDRLPAWLAAAAGVTGAAVSVYLTFVHYAAVPLACSTSGAIDCERVLSSGFGVVGGTGFPTSALGILWFAASAGFAAAQLAGRDSPLVLRAQLVWAALGLVTVIGLVFIEIVAIGAVCLWCTVAHVLVIITFLLVITMWQSAAARDRA